MSDKISIRKIIEAIRLNESFHTSWRQINQHLSIHLCLLRNPPLSVMFLYSFGFYIIIRYQVTDTIQH